LSIYKTKKAWKEFPLLSCCSPPIAFTAQGVI
jgi:hypothetical protein